MKKFIPFLSLLALALLSVAFVSCSKDDDPIEDNPSTPVEEPYKAVKFWASNELLEIADVTCSGLLTSYTFDETKTIHEDFGEGKLGSAFVVPNADMKDKKIVLTFKLKSDWETIIGDRKKLTLASQKSLVRNKNVDFPFFFDKFKGRANIDLDYEAERVALYGWGLDEALKIFLDMCSFEITEENFE